MSEFNLTRNRLLGTIAAAWILGIVAIFAFIAATRPDPVIVVHWTNGHLLRDESGLRLLRQMADEFNQAGHKTPSGRPIEVQVFYYGSAEQANDLLSRATRGVPIDRERPDPTIVTPSAAHWLIPVNQAAARTVVDLGAVREQSIARAFIGIVTYQDMAECLGWSDKEIGYADIIALRNDPRGWASYPCARAEWGQKPLVAFTDPTTSSTGRSVLFSLYAIAAENRPEQLTVADVNDPKVVEYVKGFQKLIDHYEIGTIPVNTLIHQGPRWGHFFLMPEDNLIHLYDGTETAITRGWETQAPPLERPMVMIYPKEGTMVRNNCACLVQASWVTEEHIEGAKQWTAYLHEDQQQRDFMAAGFRPVTGLVPTDPISGRYGLDPTGPQEWFEPAQISPEVAAAIDQGWEQVKKPGIVTMVVDVSGSMAGGKLDQAKDGVIRALDNMAKNNQVGLLTFSDAIDNRIPVAPLDVNRFAIANAAQEARAHGGTALYDAVRAGIEMTDAVPSQEDAIRGIIVLTDGQANEGQTQLDDLISMMSSDEVSIRQFTGFDDDSLGVDESGRNVKKEEVIGTGLAIKTRHPIQVFFIGIGHDADMEVGRMLAEATGAAFQGVTEKDLAGVLEEYSKYF